MTITVLKLAPANSPSSGQTYTLRNIPLATFMPAQVLGNTKGGSGDDEILLGKTLAGLDTSIQTGAGNDVLTMGSFGQAGNFAATITDFTLGVDKVRIFNGTYAAISLGNLRDYVHEATASTPAWASPIDGGSGTRLIIDLDGAGSLTQTYTLDLKNVAYSAANTATIFGI
ncbi:M10 family metallopeptidase C-terminal domain-containing protein [Herbaspirillum rubrisubalbicans]|uniref:M10 family metallopeptidase C-terminal domain-containing protein n=1 Tax=Herbaspirillum rubrisubalbicans TaxID=80842 RepID=UPI0015C5468C|nr:hypothetical protein [Herbaspirillum rubrisubalbicans]NQE50065.1 hypothetical protein [Herbaspirillum rubrisubalbicans]